MTRKQNYISLGLQLLLEPEPPHPSSRRKSFPPEGHPTASQVRTIATKGAGPGASRETAAAAILAKAEIPEGGRP